MNHFLRITLLILALGGTYAASGQGYPMFLWEKGTEWLQVSSGAPLYYCEQGHEVGDTIWHQGKLLFKMCAYEYGSCTDSTLFTYYIYHDTLARRIYRTEHPDSTMYAIYDFNLAVGDTLAPPNVEPGTDPLIVTRLDTLVIGGKNIRMFVINTYLYETYLIEGIGSDAGFGWGIQRPPEAGGWGLSCFSSPAPVDPSPVPVFYGACFENKFPCDLFIGIEQTQVLPGVSLYPNPAQESLRLEGIPVARYAYEILDALGRECRAGIADQDAFLSVSGLASGLYYLKTAYGTWRFVKE
ncbi:MAG: T9SS type A sorting domain-containing protein [Saprospiraceae bacterium]|nr:T9SS type A sorting domain-containing protein [Saprospiraceae bacterium]